MNIIKVGYLLLAAVAMLLATDLPWIWGKVIAFAGYFIWYEIYERLSELKGFIFAIIVFCSGILYMVLN